ncbi:hypothetical protein DUI87_25621 [Hirundo rustica rustica]|uniref:Uncharacterized protein n=1 Tax=Hirundo rustica rustica TaxID=333673 RepID=A0A3M0JAK7_HIRRU|nr:hypothetical protein DUI87_25621 [Hirundo rustica rustica]
MESPGWSENPDRILAGIRNGVARLERKPGPDSGRNPEWSHPVGAKTRTGFFPESGMESPGWSENPDRIFPGIRNGVTRLERKPGPDSGRNPEWSRPVGAKTRTGFFPESGMESPGWSENPDRILVGIRNGVTRLEQNPDRILDGIRNGVARLERKPGPDFSRNPEWSHPVGAKTRTGFWPESGMESPGWSENPDRILAGIRNGVTRLERKPGPDFSRNPEWSHPVGAKTRTGFFPESGMESPGWSENPDRILAGIRNGVTRLERKPGPDSGRNPEWSHPVGAKTRTGFWPESGMESPGWSENPDRILAGIRNGVTRLERKPGPDSGRNPEWSHPVGAKTRTGFWPESGMESPGWSENPDRIFPGIRNGVTRLEQKPGPDSSQNPEWTRLVGGKTWTGFWLESGLESPGLRETMT